MVNIVDVLYCIIKETSMHHQELLPFFFFTGELEVRCQWNIAKNSV